MSMIHWSKLIVVVVLLSLTACHRSAKTEQIDNQENTKDILSICVQTDTIYQVKAFDWQNKHVFVVPSFWDKDTLSTFCNEEALLEQESNRLLADTNTRLMYSQLPVLFIEMEESDREHIYKDRSVSPSASIALFSADGTNEYEGPITIKTRGNTSWREPEKKSFTIKLSKSTQLPYLEKGKSYTLVPNSMDNTFLCNALAFQLAKSLGIFAPDFIFITLYINGNYMGIYQMTNKIEVGKRSVDIVDLEKENKQVNDRPLNDYPTFSEGELRMSGYKKGVCINNPEDITGGYRLDYNEAKCLLELSISGFVSQAGDPVRIKSPKHASREQVDYISNLYNQMETAFMSPTGVHPETGKHYSEYLDMESFARNFLIQEITQNIDGGLFSFLMYKDVGDSSLMVAGPAWDFDRGMKKFDDPSLPFNRLLTVSKTTMKEKPFSGNLLYWLWQHEDFQNMAKRIFINELHTYVIDSSRWQPYADSIIDLLQHDAECNRMRFAINYNKSYREDANAVKDFIKERDSFLYWLWTSDSSDIVTVQVTGPINPRKSMTKELVMYGNKTDGVTISPIPWEILYNRDPTLLGYYIYGTDSLVKDGTTFYHDQCLEIRWKNPNWFQIQYRRVRKRIKKLFHLEEPETVVDPNSFTLVSLPQ